MIQRDLIPKTKKDIGSFQSCRSNLLITPNNRCQQTYTRNSPNKIFTPIPINAKSIGIAIIRQSNRSTRIKSQSPCPCGSGKKYKRCCLSFDQDRVQSENVICELDQSINSTCVHITIEESTQRIRLFDKFTKREIIPQRAFLQGDFKHKEKPNNTPTYKIPLEPNHLYGYQLNALSRYHAIFGIDTNAFSNVEGLYGGSSLRLCLEELRTTNSQIEIKLMPFGDISFMNEKKFENLNWAGTIYQIKNHSAYEQHMRIGIVVDSDFSELDFYNSRIKPYAGNEILPEGFELIYATSDKKNKNDSLLNQFIYKCDSWSHRMMSEVTPEGIIELKNHFTKSYE